MKRFTETLKWRDPWFRKLSPEAKLLWLHVCDNCECAGVIEIDLDAASFDIGRTVTPEHLKEIATRLEILPSGKTWLSKFIAFQYGRLSSACRPHFQVIESVKKNGLPDTLLEGYSSTSYHASAVPNHDTHGIPYAKGIQGVCNTPQEKEKEKDPDKDPDKDKEPDQGLTLAAAPEKPPEKFQKPALDQVRLWSAKIGLPEGEAEKFFNYYESNGWRVGKNPMKSWPAALVNWRKNYEERKYQNHGTNKNSGGGSARPREPRDYAGGF